MENNNRWKEKNTRHLVNNRIIRSRSKDFIFLHNFIALLCYIVLDNNREINKGFWGCWLDCWSPLSALKYSALTRSWTYRWLPERATKSMISIQLMKWLLSFLCKSINSYLCDCVYRDNIATTSELIAEELFHPSKKFILFPPTFPRSITFRKNCAIEKQSLISFFHWLWLIFLWL